jgi:hypothetical protein
MQRGHGGFPLGQGASLWNAERSSCSWLIPHSVLERLMYQWQKPSVWPAAVAQRGFGLPESSGWILVPVPGFCLMGVSMVALTARAPKPESRLPVPSSPPTP